MFKILLTYHQVDHTFLEGVYTFGQQDRARDLCLTYCNANDTLRTLPSEVLCLEKQGRSGREIHMSYLIRSVEWTGMDIWSWRSRPTAVYHSFDVLTGRSFWVNIKGDATFYRRLMEGRSPCPVTEAPGFIGAHSTKSAVLTAFQTSLATHLLYLSWCDENWREFINQFESKISELTEKARTSPVDDHLPEGGPDLVTFPRSTRQHDRAATHVTRTWNTRSSSTKMSYKDTWIKLKHAVRRPQVRDYPRIANEPLPMYLTADDRRRLENDLHAVTQPDPKEILDKFRFGDVQTLHELDDRIQTSVLTIKLDCETLYEIHDYYEMCKPALQDVGLEGHDEIVDQFLMEVNNIIRRLKTHQTQLEYLASKIRGGVSLVSSIDLFFPFRLILPSTDVDM